MSKISVVYVGIDVHKDTNSVCVFSMVPKRFDLIQKIQVF